MVGITVGARCQVMPGARRGVVMFVGPIEQIKPGYWVRLLYFFQPCHIPLPFFLPFFLAFLLSSFLLSSFHIYLTIHIYSYISICQAIDLPIPTCMLIHSPAYPPVLLSIYLVICSHFSILTPPTNI